MQTKHLCVFIHIWTKGEVGTVTPVKALQLNIHWLLLFGSFVFLCLVFLILSSLFIATLWSPAGKELASVLLLVLLI